MKNALLMTAPLLFVAACSQPTANSGNAAQADTSNAAAIAANTRADGSVIDESKPHEHTDETAHDKPMDMAMMGPAAGDSEATRGSKAAMMKMMHGMPAYTGDADVDFNKQMRGHHVAAIEMAEVQLKHGKDPESRALAQEIIVAQKKEIAGIDAWLAKRGQ
jgi:Domain of unknown function (DUF305)